MNNSTNPGNRRGTGPVQLCSLPPRHESDHMRQDGTRFQPGHVFDRPHAAGEHGAALTSFNRSGAKR